MEFLKFFSGKRNFAKGIKVEAGEKETRIDAIRCIFFDSSAKKKEEKRNGILLENSNGKLLITRETIENLS